MANETIYNPGKKSYKGILLEKAMKEFPELDPHFAFNNFIANNPELFPREYNVIGGMNVADVAKPGKKQIGYDWSDPYSLSGLAGIYSIVDTMKQPGQDWKEGFADWYRNVKGIGIQRDWNPLGLLYDEDEADYYKNLYKKTRLEEKKSAQLEENKILADVAGVTSDKIKTGADAANIRKVEQHTGRPMSEYRRSRPASERQYTGHGRSGMGRDPSDRMAKGGIIDKPLPGRSRDI